MKPHIPRTYLYRALSLLAHIPPGHPPGIRSMLCFHLPMALKSDRFLAVCVDGTSTHLLVRLALELCHVLECVRIVETAEITCHFRDCHRMIPEHFLQSIQPLVHQISQSQALTSQNWATRETGSDCMSARSSAATFLVLTVMLWISCSHILT